jgi:DNA-damage-inducible protein J
MPRVRMDDDVKVRAMEAWAAMGLSVSDAERIFLKRAVAGQAFPKLPRSIAKARSSTMRSTTSLSRRASRVRQLNAQVIDSYEPRFKNVYYNRESCWG